MKDAAGDPRLVGASDRWKVKKSKVEGERRRGNSYRCYNCNMDTYGGWVKKKEERGLEIRTRSESGESSDTWDRISYRCYNCNMDTYG